MTQNRKNATVAHVGSAVRSIRNQRKSARVSHCGAWISRYFRKFFISFTQTICAKHIPDLLDGLVERLASVIGQTETARADYSANGRNFVQLQLIGIGYE